MPSQPSVATPLHCIITRQYLLYLHVRDLSGRGNENAFVLFCSNLPARIERCIRLDPREWSGKAPRSLSPASCADCRPLPPARSPAALDYGKRALGVSKQAGREREGVIFVLGNGLTKSSEDLTCTPTCAQTLLLSACLVAGVSLVRSRMTRPWMSSSGPT